MEELILNINELKELNMKDLKELRKKAKTDPALAKELRVYETAMEEKRLKKEKELIKNIRTYEDACAELKISTKKAKVKLGKHGAAFYKLAIIAQALNGGKLIPLRSEDAQHWYPVFTLVKRGEKLVFSGSSNDLDSIQAGCSALFTLRSKELSDHFGKQFLYLWKQYIL